MRFSFVRSLPTWRRIAFALALSLLGASPAATAPIALDASFGTDGVASIPGAASARAAVLQPDGKIVVAAFGAAPDFLVARLETDGTLDPTFGTGGIVTTDLATGSNDTASAIALQADGKIVVVGSTYDGAQHDFAIVRYTASGTLDAGFGTGGIVTRDILGDTDHATGVALQADGKIIVTGDARNTVVSDDELVIVRYDATGTLDPTFGTGGITITPIPGRNANALALALQPDGKAVLGGRIAPEDDFVLARYTTSGVLDAAFGTGGIVTTDLGSDDDRIRSLALQPDGKILALGSHRERGGNGRIVYALARYAATGTLDTTFGGDGVVTTKFSEGGNEAETVLLEPGGSIVAGGEAPLGETIAAARYFPDGSLDDAFGTCGRLEVALSGFGVRDMLRQGDGKLVFAGGIAGNAAVARMLATTVLCPATPASGCKVPTVPFKAKLTIKDKAADKADKLSWSWLKGEATSSGDLGNPLLDNGFALCFYDESGAPTLISEAHIPPAGDCGKPGKPCWKRTGFVGFKYKDSDATPCGITKVSLKGGIEGKAKIKVIGKGTALKLPTLPLPLPVRVQLQGDDGECFEATYSADQFQVNTPTVFKGKAN